MQDSSGHFAPAPDPAAPITPLRVSPQRTRRFMLDTVWTWVGVAANLLTGLVLSPYIIQRLGVEGYGLWTLIFSLVGYYTLMDLGIRSAVITMTAEYQARGENEKVNVLLSTTLAYSVAATIVLLAVSAVLSYGAADWFRVPAAYRQPFQISLVLVSFVMPLGFAFHIITGCLEGLQRFQELNQLRTGLLVIRAIGAFSLLGLGYGLVALTVCYVVAGVLIFPGYWVVLKKALPGLRISRRLVRYPVLKEAATYGFHTTTATVGQVLVEETPFLIIARLISTAAIGYFSLPFRVIQYPADMITRVTSMLAPIGAEFDASERSCELLDLAVLANRYSVILYAPFALVLLTWGTDVIGLWVGAEYARESGPLLVFFVIGTWLALVGQSSSVSLLFGLRAHRLFAAGLIAEGVAVAIGIFAFAHNGLVFAAMVSAAAMLLNRGLWSAWLLCRRLNANLPSYLFAIYARPLVLAAPLLFLLHKFHQWNPLPVTWPLMILISAVTSLLYFGAAYLWCLAPEHRRLVAAQLYQARQTFRAVRAGGAR